MRMTDEKYEYVQDLKEKNHTARSARHARTHNGKGGAVKLPSDYLSEKEIESMHGECKSYRLNDPMTWDEFICMPDDLKVMYVKALRKRYNVPDKYIAEMLGVDGPRFSKFVAPLNLNVGRAAGGARVWDKEGFLAWCGGAKGEAVTESETPVDISEEDGIETMTLVEAVGEEKAEEIEKILEDLVNNIIEDDTEGECGEAVAICTVHHMPVIPKSGQMTFENNDADDALDTIRCLLSNVKANITISWECVR